MQQRTFEFATELAHRYGVWCPRKKYKKKQVISLDIDKFIAIKFNTPKASNAWDAFVWLAGEVNAALGLHEGY